jgi:hypothetical protein
MYKLISDINTLLNEEEVVPGYFSVAASHTSRNIQQKEMKMEIHPEKFFIM